MNENAERINGWAAMIGVVAAMGSYAAQVNLSQVFGDVVLATCMLGAFIIHSTLKMLMTMTTWMVV